MKISVLMSLYSKEKPEFLRESLDSILNQTLLPDEVLVVIDGPITVQLQSVLDFYLTKTPLLRLLPQEKNRGLGSSLAIGVQNCRFDLVARMDTDDIMRADRLEVQSKLFENDKTLSIVSSNIVEFDGDITNITGHRNVPADNDEIRKFSKKRNPFNHMSVMFKREAVIEAGNYQPLSGFEDYYLWVRMLKNGDKGHNVQQDLVYARTGSSMFQRRGGLKYLISGIKGRYRIYREGLGTIADFVFVSLVHVIFSLAPNSLRKKLYEKKLRES